MHSGEDGYARSRNYWLAPEAMLLLRAANAFSFARCALNVFKTVVERVGCWAALLEGKTCLQSWDK